MISNFWVISAKKWWEPAALMLCWFSNQYVNKLQCWREALRHDQAAPSVCTHTKLKYCLKTQETQWQADRLIPYSVLSAEDFDVLVSPLCLIFVITSIPSLMFPDLYFHGQYRHMLMFHLRIENWTRFSKLKVYRLHKKGTETMMGALLKAQPWNKVVSTNELANISSRATACYHLFGVH